MPDTRPFLFQFKRTVEMMLRGTRRLSLRHFIDEYDYDDFLEGEASKCPTSRTLALAFGTRFLSTVPPEYAEALSIALVSFLSECAGRTNLDNSDIEAVKTLVALPTKDKNQLTKWMDAYFRDVA
jgi:hypothetical protein